MANISTNQVSQLYVLAADTTVTVETLVGGKGGAFVKVDDERTDLIQKGGVLHTTLVEATAATEKLNRKGVLVQLAADVNGGQPVAGQDYVITLEYRGNIGLEDTYHKFADAHAKVGMDAATLLQELAKSLLAQRGVEVSPLYDVVLADGTAVTAANIDTITDAGFYIVEPKPFYKRGTFPETLMNIGLACRPIIVDGDEEEKWLANTKFESVVGKVTGVTAIPNTHKVMDLEYFCKGERGLSAALHTPYVDQIDPDFKVKESAAGYDLLIVHYAFVGANANNQKSEKDMIFAIEHTGASKAKLEGIETAVKAI